MRRNFSLMDNIVPWICSFFVITSPFFFPERFKLIVNYCLDTRKSLFPLSTLVAFYIFKNFCGKFSLSVLHILSFTWRIIVRIETHTSHDINFFVKSVSFHHSLKMLSRRFVHTEDMMSRYICARSDCICEVCVIHAPSYREILFLGDVSIMKHFILFRVESIVKSLVGKIDDFWLFKLLLQVHFDIQVVIVAGRSRCFISLFVKKSFFLVEIDHGLISSSPRHFYLSEVFIGLMLS